MAVAVVVAVVVLLGNGDDGGGGDDDGETSTLYGVGLRGRMISSRNVLSCDDDFSLRCEVRKDGVRRSGMSRHGIVQVS